MINVLFLCTGNSARSVLSECYMNAQAGFRAYSAGSKPTGTPNPFALDALDRHNIPQDTGDSGDIRSKSWDEFALPDAPIMDYVITVCDNAAGEVCPIWPTNKDAQSPQKLHWSFPDPAAATGTDENKRAVFDEVFADIRSHIDAFVSEKR